MATIRERMTEFLKSQEVSDYAFERQAELSRGYMSKCINPTGAVLEKLCRIYTELSAEWLLRGEGPMLREVPAVDNTAQVTPEVNLSRETLKALMREVLAEEIREIKKEVV